MCRIDHVRLAETQQYFFFHQNLLFTKMTICHLCIKWSWFWFDFLIYVIFHLYYFGTRHFLFATIVKCINYSYYCLICKCLCWFIAQWINYDYNSLILFLTVSNHQIILSLTETALSFFVNMLNFSINVQQL